VRLLKAAVLGGYDSLVACLQGEILQLSEKYVRSLARDTRNAIDGPYAGRLTGYGMFTLVVNNRVKVKAVAYLVQM